ncbi:MAG: hypothetical protein IPG45_11395 [Deltaproteobacteria bacterium]|nr:hypothetical protein [Deltaproteobacteria bacterium]
MSDEKTPVLRPFPNSLCHRCQHLRVVESAKGSVFLKCTALPQKYPSQPVLLCPAFQPKPAESAS